MSRDLFVTLVLACLITCVRDVGDKEVQKNPVVILPNEIVGLWNLEYGELVRYDSSGTEIRRTRTVFDTLKSSISAYQTYTFGPESTANRYYWENNNVKDSCFFELTYQYFILNDSMYFSNSGYLFGYKLLQLDKNTLVTLRSDTSTGTLFEIINGYTKLADTTLPTGWPQKKCPMPTNRVPKALSSDLLQFGIDPQVLFPFFD
jgi:hypothetical protein